MTVTFLAGGWLFAGDPRWQPCSTARPGTMAVDPCLAEPDASRRANMYRYVGDSTSAKNGILPVTGIMPKLGASGTTDDVGGFTASYLRRGDTVLIPIRLGVGARLGINAGYMRFSQRNRWVPF